MMRIIWIAFVVTAFCPIAARADPPPNSFDIDFSGQAAIWNPFDDFEACESFMGATLCLNLSDVMCDGQGKCDGDATWTFSGILDGSINGSFTASARCKLPKKPDADVCKAKISSCETADGQVNGFDATIDRCSLKGPVRANGLFDGTGKVRVCILGLLQPGVPFCETAPGGFAYFVNPPIPWTLSLDIETIDGSIEGTASDDLGFDYEVKGTYKDSKDASKLTIKGLRGTKEMPDPSRGSVIKIKDLVMTGSTIDSGEVKKIKVQGNKTNLALD